MLPSLNEGISNTILEAMATARAVVAARVGGNGELIEDGVSGTLYDAQSAGGLVAAIQRYLDNPVLREAHGAAARERCIAQFSMEAMVRGYSDLYDRLLARN